MHQGKTWQELDRACISRSVKSLFNPLSDLNLFRFSLATAWHGSLRKPTFVLNHPKVSLVYHGMLRHALLYKRVSPHVAAYVRTLSQIGGGHRNLNVGNHRSPRPTNKRSPAKRNEVVLPQATLYYSTQSTHPLMVGPVLLFRVLHVCKTHYQ